MRQLNARVKQGELVVDINNQANNVSQPSITGSMQNTTTNEPPKLATGVSNTTVSDKSFLGTLVLAYFVGFVGMDRFYVGKKITGILKLITVGGLGIWVLVDILLVSFGSYKDKQGNHLKGYQENKDWAKYLGWGVIITYILIIVFYGSMMAMGLFSLESSNSSSVSSEF